MILRNMRGYGFFAVFAACGTLLAIGCTSPADISGLDELSAPGAHAILEPSATTVTDTAEPNWDALYACGTGSGSGSGSSVQSGQAAPAGLWDSVCNIVRRAKNPGGTEIPANYAARFATCMAGQKAAGVGEAEATAWCTGLMWARAAFWKLGKDLSCGQLEAFCMAQPSYYAKNGCMLSYVTFCSGLADFVQPFVRPKTPL